MCHQQLCGDIFREQSECGRKAFLVTGTPGTGKSSFISFFAAHVLAAGKTVYLQHPGRRIVLDFNACTRTPNAFVVLDEKEWLKAMHTQKNGWYLVDGDEPCICDNMPTLLVASPKTSGLKDWQKQRQVLARWMPIWTLEELKYVGTRVFGMTDDELERRFRRREKRPADHFSMADRAYTSPAPTRYAPPAEHEPHRQEDIYARRRVCKEVVYTPPTPTRRPSPQQPPDEHPALPPHAAAE
ncbi:hypothetical protein AB1Y20_004988 [Prymnesium parvum]|uniref:Uncharacterized protein n=1 Tax=Prymnesium parvum TaxID=97485 RepID=A0AB34J2Y1_PRYPA